MKDWRVIIIIVFLTVLSISLLALSVSGDTLESGGGSDFRLDPGDSNEKDIEDLKSGYIIKYSWDTSNEQGRIDLEIRELTSGKILHEVKSVKSEINEITINTDDTYLFIFSSNYENYTVGVDFKYNVFSPSSDDSPGFGLLETLLIISPLVACIGWKRRRNERI